MDIKCILVPTDYSEDAKAALEAAIEFSKVFGAKIVLVHAYHIETPAVYGGNFVAPQDILEPVREAAQSSMEQLIKELTARGVEVESRVVMEYPSHAILDEANKLPADMIVMGTRGLTGIKHVLVGSTAERIVRLAACPVVTIKAEEKK